MLHNYLQAHNTSSNNSNKVTFLKLLQIKINLTEKLFPHGENSEENA